MGVTGGGGVRGWWEDRSIAFPADVARFSVMFRDDERRVSRAPHRRGIRSTWRVRAWRCCASGAHAEPLRSMSTAGG